MYRLPGRNHPGTGRRVVGYFLWCLVMRQGLACAPVFEFLGGIRRAGRFCMICKVLDLGVGWWWWNGVWWRWLTKLPLSYKNHCKN